jgi:hypothetical protein
MKNFLTHTKVLLCLLPLALLVTAKANAEPFKFTYIFKKDESAALTGYIVGKFDEQDSDIVWVRSFGTVSFRDVPYPAIEHNEFDSVPFGDRPVMSVSGTVLNFRACPSGFTTPDFQTGVPKKDCPFRSEGGFLVSHLLPPDGDGTATAAHPNVNQIFERPITVGNWSLELLPDADGDDIADAQDNCPTVSNTSQTDTDEDGIGNACDSSPAP